MSANAVAITKSGAARRRLPMSMTMREAVAIAGTLGKTSKMPGRSYGLSAFKCGIGGKLAKVPGSVCAACYARTDFYKTWIPLLAGHDRRERSLSHPRWCDAMVRMISASCRAPNNFFRWHDSGDIRSVEHFARIVEVCERTPDVNHWLPTKEFGMLVAFVDRGGTIPSNLVVRLSAYMIDAEPVVPASLADLPTSTVSTVSLLRSGVKILDGKGCVECRAVELRENSCGDCRACWDARVRNVNYPQH